MHDRLRIAGLGRHGGERVGGTGQGGGEGEGIR